MTPLLALSSANTDSPGSKVTFTPLDVPIVIDLDGKKSVLFSSEAQPAY